MIKKILIANRGEIAVRIIRTCKEMGIGTVAIYNSLDRFALHASMADESYSLGDGSIAETYLSVEKILAIAKKSFADAVHPGYGFLSENADFIESVRTAGLGFIGPSAESVRKMGDKTTAKSIVKAAGVPVVPGSDGEIKNIAELKEVVAKIDLPILLKASAGGGGKGMKKVFKESELEDAFNSASREALKFFKNGAVYAEKLIEQPKHVEIQILGDKNGSVIHLFERECSLQRRHQKIIEEAPASFLPQDLRNRIAEVAVKAAKAAGYFNAGTIEFLVDKSGDFYFLEMNTRIQVEHPVTEFITGIDIVKEQIYIESGQPLRYEQKDIISRGHSIECRLYAENPEENFVPSTGTLSVFSLPSGPGIRIDEGVYQDAEITIAFDPMIAKLTVYAEDRPSALKRMQRALDEVVILGVDCNIKFLKQLFRFDDFVAGVHNINSIESNFEKLLSLQILDASSSNLDAAIIAAMSSVGENKGPVNSSAEMRNTGWESQKYG